jgi:hypothetical protein
MPTQTSRILTAHFFRRFFDNDTLSANGDTQTSVLRALIITAVPGLMTAFWLQTHYPHRPLWGIAADRYFFVLYAFVAMGAITAFEWDMLFPDRADFLILLPLPLKSRELFYAKGRALLTFLGLFLVASNLFALVLYPGLSTTRDEYYVHTLAVHAIAVFTAGIFAAFSMLAIKGLSIALLPDQILRWFSPLLQCLAMAGLLLLMLLFPLVGGHLQSLLEGSPTLARCFPPLWFLGLYDHLNNPATASPASASLATIALAATASPSSSPLPLTRWPGPANASAPSKAPPQPAAHPAISSRISSTERSSATPSSEESSTSSLRPSPATPTTRPSWPPTPESAWPWPSPASSPSTPPTTPQTRSRIR